MSKTKQQTIQLNVFFFAEFINRFLKVLTEISSILIK